MFTLTAPDDGKDWYFGWSLSIGVDVNNDGWDDVIVGADNADLTSGMPNAGAAYVFATGFQPSRGVSVGPTNTILNGPFPNPTSGFSQFRLVINEPDPADVRLDLLDMAGRRYGLAVRYHEVDEGRFDIMCCPTTQLVPGTYSLRINFGGQAITRRLVIVR
jgi:hypothetical protein